MDHTPVHVMCSVTQLSNTWQHGYPHGVLGEFYSI